MVVRNVLAGDDDAEMIFVSAGSFLTRISKRERMTRRNKIVVAEVML